MSIKLTARLAGFTYLIVVLTGIFSLAYVPSRLIDWSDATATANNIINFEFLFRLGIVVGIICYICFLILPFILYKLFESVNKNCAVLMVVLAVTSVPISLFNMINKMDVLTLLSGVDYLSVFGVDQIYAQVMLLLKSYNNGLSLVQIFWGLWLFPFGYLALKSSYIPKFLGVLLMLGCLGYLVKFFGTHLFPYIDIPGFVRLPATVGEIGTCLWLLLVGVRDQVVEEENESIGIS